MFEFEIRERADENLAAASYNELYHGFPVAQSWDADFFAFVAEVYGRGDRVLDLGCGPGSMWGHWQTLDSPGALVGVDLSEAMIQEARQNHPDGEFHVGRAHALPFPDGSFDIVVASAVLHHIPDEHLRSALDEIARVLDEHGRLVGREPNGESFGQVPGWFSGAIMSFRHLAFRLTRSREYPEPQLGDHHHAFARDAFVETAQQVFHMGRLEERYPFSQYLVRVRSQAVADFARMMDRLLADRIGAMFYYDADANYTDAAEVRRTAELARHERLISDAEFLAYLQVAAEKLEHVFTHADDAS